jgi:hypothetical protein
MSANLDRIDNSKDNEGIIEQKSDDKDDGEKQNTETDTTNMMEVEGITDFQSYFEGMADSSGLAQWIHYNAREAAEKIFNDNNRNDSDWFTSDDESDEDSEHNVDNSFGDVQIVNANLQQMEVSQCNNNKTNTFELPSKKPRLDEE